MLPPDHRTFHFHNDPFFYHGGHFYHHHNNGYIRVRPPIGLRLDILPDGYSRVYFGGMPYYYYDDTYYDYVPAEKVYIVVDKPAAPASAVLTYDLLTMADGTHLDGVYIGGTKSVIQFEVNGEVREIARDKIASIQFAQPK